MYSDSLARVPSPNATNSNLTSSPFDRLQHYTATHIANESNSNATLSPFDRLQQYTATHENGPSKSPSSVANGGSSGELASARSEILIGTESLQPTSSPTKNDFLCGLCPDSRFPLAHSRIYAHGRVTATCLELDFMLTFTETSQGCLGVLDSIGYDIDIWSFCECPGVDPPKLCHLCPEAKEGDSLPNKIVDGLYCSEWAHYAANALNAEYCSELIETVGTIGTCCPQGVLHDRIP